MSGKPHGRSDHDGHLGAARQQVAEQRKRMLAVLMSRPWSAKATSAASRGSWDFSEAQNGPRTSPGSDCQSAHGSVLALCTRRLSNLATIGVFVTEAPK
jgi:hypothetical protein